MRTDRIAHLYTHAGPYASVFVDVSRDSEAGAHEVELQTRDACRRLSDQGAPKAVVDRVAERLAVQSHEGAPVSRAVVATADDVLFDEVAHVRTPQITALWGALPDVGDWLTHEDGAVAFVLALVDHEGGDVATYRSNAPGPDDVESTGSEAQHEHKTRGGGLAHMRYQRTAENVWAHNAGDVADQLRSRIADGYRLIVLAGEPQSRSQVLDDLGDPDAAEVVELEHGGRARDGGDDSLHDAVREVLAEHAVSRRLEATHTLKDRLGRGEGAVTGVGDVADAFVRGQVQSLLIDPAEAADLQVVPADHPGLPVDVGDSPLRADLALVAAAAQTGAEVVVSPSRALSGTPVAALLRWEQAG